MYTVYTVARPTRIFAKTRKIGESARATESDLSEVGTTAQIEPSEGDMRGRVTLDVVMATAQKFFDSCATVGAVEVVLQIFQLEAKRRRGQLATELNKQALTAAQVLR